MLSPELAEVAAEDPWALAILASVSAFLLRSGWQLVQCDVVGSGVAGFNLGFHASRILCFDLDSSRTGAFGNEVDVVEVHRFLTHFATYSVPQNGEDQKLKGRRTDERYGIERTAVRSR